MLYQWSMYEDEQISSIDRYEHHLCWSRLVEIKPGRAGYGPDTAQFQIQYGVKMTNVLTIMHNGSMQISVLYCVQL